MPSEVGSGPRLVVWSIDPDSDIVKMIESWMAGNAPDASYSIAELANPARERGEPLIVVAIEADDGAKLAWIKTALAKLEQSEFVDPPNRLHLASR